MSPTLALKPLNFAYLPSDCPATPVSPYRTPLFVPPSHPALLPPSPATACHLHTPPHTPSSPVRPSLSAAKMTQLSPPIPSYPLLRANHASALKYVIAKLRWEQMSNGYLRAHDAWANHNMMIQKLEDELISVEAAQKGLDRFPNCYAGVAYPKAHGPVTKETYEETKRLEKEKDKLLDEKLEAQFPFIKQLFIGPMTKAQARNDRLLRMLMKEGDFDDLELLLPSENLRMLMEGQEMRKPGVKRMTAKEYEAERMEKEKVKIAALKPAKVATPARVTFGPKTEEEHLASLPVFGPKTRAETLLPQQREQRQAILTWLRKPWPEYEEDVADAMVKLGRVAVKRIEEDAKKVKEEEAKEGEVVKKKGPAKKVPAKDGEEKKDDRGKGDGKKEAKAIEDKEAKVTGEVQKVAVVA